VIARSEVGATTSAVARLAVTLPPEATVWVSTFAGSGDIGRQDGFGTCASFHTPNGGSWGPDGCLYLPDGYGHLIRRITARGEVGTYAGTGAAGYTDGWATNASFDYPLCVYVDQWTNVYVADGASSKVRKVSVSGWVSTVAGSGQQGYLDGCMSDPIQPRMNYPNHLVMDTHGDLLVSEYLNHVVRRVTIDGCVETWAGTGAVAGYRDGPRTNALFDRPGGVVLDRQGNVYVPENGNHRLRRISPDGQVSTLAGSGEPGFSDGFGTNATFHTPDGLAVDAHDNIFLADVDNHAIRVITPSGAVKTLAGLGYAGFADGDQTAALFNVPAGMAFDTNGDLFVMDGLNNRIRKIALLRPQVIEQPRTQTALQGMTVRLSSVAVGKPPLSYQWLFNGVPIEGSTDAELLLPNVQPTNAGSYAVLATNSLGAVSSQVAMVVVSMPPAIKIISPAIVGGSVRVSVETVLGASYALECKDSLNAPTWRTLQVLPGTGGTLMLTDNTATSSVRFYRVRAQ
jgi:sugar lactone lactonase YvrE